MTGCLRLATNPDRWTEFKRLATTARSFGMEMELISPAEVKRMWPLMDVDDLIGASWLPTDGQACPSDITQSLAKGARMHGAQIIEGVRVTGFEMERRPHRRRPHHRRPHRERNGGQLRRPVGPRDRRAGRHQRAAAAGQAPVHHHRKDRRPRDRRADASATPTAAPISRKKSAAS